MGLMKVTGHLVLTPRSKTMTGTFAHACSTAGVRVAVVFGDTISASQPLPSRSVMSEICLSSLLSASATVNDLISGCSLTSACMFLKPTCRHGLPTPALEKHRLYGPGFLYFAVSTVLASSACSHGLSAGPVAVLVRSANSLS